VNLLWNFPHYYAHNLKKEESGFSKTRVPIYRTQWSRISDLTNNIRGCSGS